MYSIIKKLEIYIILRGVWRQPFYILTFYIVCVCVCVCVCVYIYIYIYIYFAHLRLPIFFQATYSRKK
jgi:ABC-type proline/glycine betaine transport system permease subunit